MPDDFKVVPGAEEIEARAEAAMDAELGAVLAGTSTEPPAAPAPEPPAAAPAPTLSPDPSSALSEPVVAAPVTPAAPATPEYSAAVYDLIAKYGGHVGDPASVVAAMNKAAEEHWQLSRQALERPTAPAPAGASPAPAQEPAPSQETQWYDTQLRDLTSEWQALDQRYGATLQKQAEQREKVASLTQQLLDADPDLGQDGEFKLKRQIKSEEGRLRQMDQQITEIMSRGQAIRKEGALINQSRQQAVRMESLIQSRQAEVQQREQADVSAFRGSFDQAVEGASSKIDPDFKQEFKDWAEAKALHWIQTPNPDGSIRVIEDPVAFAAQLANAYAASLERYAGKKSATYSQQKAQDAKVGIPATAASAAATPEKKLRSVAEWDAIHEQAQF